MNIFNDLKNALENDVSWDIKLGIEAAYFDVILTARDDEDYNGSNENFYEGQNEPTYIPIRYSVVSDEVFVLLDEIIDGQVFGFIALQTIQKVMKVIYDHKNEIDELCCNLSGMDREYMETKDKLTAMNEKFADISDALNNVKIKSGFGLPEAEKFIQTRE